MARHCEYPLTQYFNIYHASIAYSEEAWTLDGILSIISLGDLLDELSEHPVHSRREHKPVPPAPKSGQKPHPSSSKAYDKLRIYYGL
jgi:hypothetical protein